MIFPLTFLSNAFVPTETLPGVLQPIAEWNPISSLSQATRELSGTRTRSVASAMLEPAAGLLAGLVDDAIRVCPDRGVRRHRIILALRN